jgi:hypothetical protein
MAALPVLPAAVAKLFRSLAGYFCRYCIGTPPYASQTRSSHGRRYFEACKLRLRLGGVASLNGALAKPSGMQQRTYTRLRSRLDKLEAALPRHFMRKEPDYPNLIYHLPPDDFQMI